MESNTDRLLPCQRAMLATREYASGSLGPNRKRPDIWRVYRCEVQVLACIVSGAGPDEELLELVCEGCAEKTPP